MNSSSVALKQAALRLELHRQQQVEQMAAEIVMSEDANDFASRISQKVSNKHAFFEDSDTDSCHNCNEGLAHEVEDSAPRFSVGDMLSAIQGKLTRGRRLTPVAAAGGKNVCLIGESSGRIKWIQPSGPRRSGEGVEDEEQGIISAEAAASGGAILCVTLLAAGFLIGPAGASVREIARLSGADIKSWTTRPKPGSRSEGHPERRTRDTRTFIIEGERAGVVEALDILVAATERYKELCEGAYCGQLVSRVQRVMGVDFMYQPPPKSRVPYAAALKIQSRPHGGGSVHTQSGEVEENEEEVRRREHGYTRRDHGAYMQQLRPSFHAQAPVLSFNKHQSQERNALAHTTNFYSNHLPPLPPRAPQGAPPGYEQPLPPQQWGRGAPAFPVAPAPPPDRPTQDRLSEVASRLSLLRCPPGSSGCPSGPNTPQRGGPLGGSSGGSRSPVALVQATQRPEWHMQTQVRSQAAAELQAMRRQHLMVAAAATGTAPSQQAAHGSGLPKREGRRFLKSSAGSDSLVGGLDHSLSPGHGAYFKQPLNSDSDPWYGTQLAGGGISNGMGAAIGSDGISGQFHESFCFQPIATINPGLATSAGPTRYQSRPPTHRGAHVPVDDLLSYGCGDLNPAALPALRAGSSLVSQQQLPFGGFCPPGYPPGLPVDSPPSLGAFGSYAAYSLGCGQPQPTEAGFTHSGQSFADFQFAQPIAAEQHMSLAHSADVAFNGGSLQRFSAEELANAFSSSPTNGEQQQGWLRGDRPDLGTGF